MLKTFGKKELEPGDLGQQGFYRVPSFPEIAIKKDGTVINKRNREILKHNYGQYVYCSFDGMSVPLHRLLCEAFHEVPEELLETERSNLIANHKDGNKLNFELDNLEWVDYSGNIIHAYKSGLRTDNKITFARNIKTGEVHEFYSQAELARFFEVDPANVVFWMKNPKAYRTCKGYFQFSYDNENWEEPSIAGKMQDIFAKSVEENGVSYLFSSLKSASDYLGIKPVSLRMHVHRYGTKPYRGYEFHRLFDYLEKLDAENYQKI